MVQFILLKTIDLAMGKYQGEYIFIYLNIQLSVKPLHTNDTLQKVNNIARSCFFPNPWMYQDLLSQSKREVTQCHFQFHFISSCAQIYTAHTHLGSKIQKFYDKLSVPVKQGIDIIYNSPSVVQSHPSPSSSSQDYSLHTCN